MKRKTLKHLFTRLLRRSLGHSYAGGTTTDARRKRLRRLLGSAQRQHRHVDIEWKRIGLFGVTVAVLCFLFCARLWPNRVSLKLGDVADREIIAQRTVAYEDTAATRQLQDERFAAVEKQYEPIQDADEQALDNLRAIFDGLDRVGRELNPPAPVRPRDMRSPAPTKSFAPPSPLQPAVDESSVLHTAVIDIHRQSGVYLPLPVISALARANAGDREQARGLAMTLVERTMKHVIPDDSDELTMFRLALKSDPTINEVSPGLRDAVGNVVGAVLLPNQHFNSRETGRKRASAASEVRPQMVHLHAGTTVIRAGDHVTQRNLDEFAALGLQTERLDAARISVICLLMVLIVSIATMYLRLFHPELYGTDSRLLLLAILTVLAVLGLKIGSTMLSIPIREIQLGYLGMMSVAATGMAIALLLSPRAALLIVALLSIASGLILNNELRFTVITMASSLTGIVSVSSIRNRGDLLRAGLTLCGTTALFTVLVGQIEGDLPTELVSGMIWGIVAGGAAIVLFLLAVALFEKPFGITTHLRLLELSDPATPILQEFRMRAPGTYAHSLMVGNIAHAAAVAIDADGLLVRVAAYYHDLGKMNRPEFFIENQSNIDNIHDRLNPSLSAIILGSHVKEGLEMVDALGFPPRVRELIQQHHGTSLMKFFYDRATEGAVCRDSSLESRFRYPGPKPQTREAAILMLADTIEAASRVLSRPTPSRISDFVAEKIDNIRADGQLDECDLTLRELKTIHDSVVRTLSGTLHARIVYPEDRTAAAAERVLAAPPAVELSAAGHATPALAITPYASESEYAAAPDAATVDDALSRLAPPPPEETIREENAGDTRTNPPGNVAARRLGSRRASGAKAPRRDR